MHSEGAAIAAPPQLDGVTSAVVVLSDRTERLARALARPTELARLTHPVDTERFVPAGPLHDAPRRVLLAGDGIRGRRRDLLFEACADLGLECLTAANDAAAGNPEVEMGRADIVVGEGRIVVEAMACGRAAYVLDADGCDGWVTPERYPALEADGFRGHADPGTAGRARLREELATYRPEMGVANRDLAAMHHSARSHGEHLVQLLGRGTSPQDAETERLHEMARLARIGWTAEASAASMRGQLEELGAELARTRHNLDNAMEIVRAHSEFVQTRRYRTALALGRPADWLRRVRRGSPDG